MLLPAVVDFYRRQRLQVSTRQDVMALYLEQTTPGRLIRRFIPERFHKSAVESLFSLSLPFERARLNTRYPDLLHFIDQTQKARPKEALVRERKILRNFDEMVLRYGLLSRLRQAGDVLIMDEGFVHRVVHFYVSAVETVCPRCIERYLDLIPLPDGLIHIHAPLERCYQRLMKRKLWRDVPMQEKLLWSFLSNAQAAVDVTVNHLRQKGQKIITIENDQASPEETIAVLNQKLAEGHF